MRRDLTQRSSPSIQKGPAPRGPTFHARNAARCRIQGVFFPFSPWGWLALHFLVPGTRQEVDKNESNIWRRRVVVWCTRWGTAILQSVFWCSLLWKCYMLCIGKKKTTTLHWLHKRPARLWPASLSSQECNGWINRGTWHRHPDANKLNMKAKSAMCNLCLTFLGLCACVL